MSLHKNNWPVLEYDTEKHAILMPNPDRAYHFPEKAVFAFVGDETERFAREMGCSQIGEFLTITKVFPVFQYQHRGEEICLCQAPLGAPAAVQILDFLIGCGVKKVISAGSCGALVDYPENEFFVAAEAVRDEGTSYKYLPPSRTIKLQERGICAIETALSENHISHTRCMTWTTDAFYRETSAMLEYRKQEGCTLVDMECAALAACAQMRDVQFGQILFTADSLADAEKHEERGWGYASFRNALMLALDAIHYL